MPRWLTRRFLSACIASLLLGLAAGLWVAPGSSSAQDDALYFVATGQRLSNEHGFLAHWRSSNGPLTLGAPITPSLDEGGLTVQYFERGRLELHPEYGGAVLRGRLGAEYAAALWKGFAPPAPLAAEAAGARHFAETGYALDAPFRAFWEAAGGMDVFGLPISAPTWEYVGAQPALVQYFERARLEHYPGASPDAAVQIGALGRDLALLRGLPTAPADPAGALAVDSLGQPAPTPAPLAVAAPAPTAPPPPSVPSAAPQAQATAASQPQAPAAPQPQATAAPAPPPAPSGSKSIVVDLSAQWLYAYDGEEVVFDAPVSTGRDGFNTPVGRYAIYHKVRSQTMRGCAGDECWSVPNVPNAMYIVGGVALHGTYWHNQFGSGVRRSHGCVNLPLDSAAWLYGWAPLGTPVTVQW
jgi:lipoprotein-anchoring transpeptidase ErfK/SrfK